MRLVVIAAVVAVALAGCGREASGRHVVLKCKLGDEVRAAAAKTITPEELTEMGAAFNARLDPGNTLEERLATLEELVCDEGESMPLRVRYLDGMLEVARMVEILELQKRLESEWGSALTGTTGKVTLVDSKRENGRLCSLLQTSSTILGMSGAAASTREWYCKATDGWHWDADEGTAIVVPNEVLDPPI